MKVNYKGCEIECYRESGMLFYSIFDDNYEVDSGFSEGNDTIRDYIKGLKIQVDEYLEDKDNATI